MNGLGEDVPPTLTPVKTVNYFREYQIIIYTNQYITTVNDLFYISTFFCILLASQREFYTLIDIDISSISPFYRQISMKDRCLVSHLRDLRL